MSTAPSVSAGSGLLVTLLVFMASHSLAAAATAISLNRVNGSRSGTLVVGFEFTNSIPITVTHLGQFDLNQDRNLPLAVEVGLWNASTRLLLAKATLPAVTNAVLDDGAFYVSIDPVKLAPGNYVIGVQALSGGERYAFDTIIRTGPGIIWRNGRTRSGNALDFPSVLLRDTVGYLGPNFKFTSDPPLALSEPPARSVYQRNSANVGSVPVSGIFSGTPDRIEARASLMDGSSGSATDWNPLDANPTNNRFSGKLVVAAGGWYRIELRALKGNVEVARTEVERVGVGEVFVTAGQSNSANHGSPTLRPKHDRVVAPAALSILNAGWQIANDPQPVATGTGGSPWPALGDLFVEQFNVPVGFLSVGWGGTALDQWQPGGTLYPRLRDALAFLGPQGLRAVLWHQGETDAANLTRTTNYVQRVSRIIAQSRIDAGWEVPWGVALVAFLPANTAASQAAVLAGQQEVIRADPLVFYGPATDDVIGSRWRWDSVHFNAAGLRLHAQRWSDAVNTYFWPGPPVALRITGLRRDTNQIAFSWSAANGLRLQKSTNINAPNWKDVLGSLNASTQSEVLTGPATFYRLAQP